MAAAAPHVLVLNGPPGVGKTTVAGELTPLIPASVCISGDAVRRFAPPHARAFLGPGSTYLAGAALADLYLGLGAQRVIVEYVFQDPVHVQRLRDALRSDAPVHLVTLWAPLVVIQQREAQRSDRARLGGRVGECYEMMKAHLADLGTVIQTEGRSAAAVAQAVHAACLTPYAPVSPRS